MVAKKPTASNAPNSRKSLVAFLAGVFTYAFLALLSASIAVLVAHGVPAGDRADLIVALAIISAAVLAGGIAGATSNTDPLAFITSAVSALRGIFRR